MKPGVPLRICIDFLSSISGFHSASYRLERLLTRAILIVKVIVACFFLVCLGCLVCGSLRALWIHRFNCKPAWQNPAPAKPTYAPTWSRFGQGPSE